MNWSLNFQKIIKFLTIGILISAISLITFYYIFKTSRTKNLAFERKEEGGIKKLQERIVHFELRGEKQRLIVKADKHYFGNDRKYYLEGNVEVRIFPKNGVSKEIVISAEEGRYNENQTFFELSKGVRVTRGSLVFKSNSILYNKKKNILRSNNKISFFSKEVIGTGRGIRYFLDSEDIEIFSKTKGKIIQSSEDTVYFQCNKLKYNHKYKRGEMIRNVLVSKNYEAFKSDYAYFELDKHERRLKNILLKNNAYIILIRKNKRLEKSQKVYELKADEILISFTEDGREISSFKGERDCILRIKSNRDLEQELIADIIEVKSIGAEELQFLARGNVWFREIKHQRKMKGDIILKEEDFLKIIGEKEKAFISFDNNNLLAKKIVISQKSEDIKAEEVENVVYPNKENKNDFAFLSPGESFSISSEMMKYNSKEKEAVFEGNVNLRQGSHLVLSEQITINRLEKLLIAKNEVKAFFSFNNSKKENEIIRVYSNEMEVNHPERHLKFKGESNLLMKNLNIKAGEIKILLEKERGEIKKIEAYNKLEVKWDRFQASGESAEYKIDEEKLIISGKVILKDKVKSKEVKGTKLTFYLASDRIFMENKEGRVTAIL